MSNFAYLLETENKVTAATGTYSSAATGYSGVYADLMPVSRPWRTTGDSDENVVYDLGAAYAIDLFAVINHNLSSGATVTVSAGTTSACSDYSTTITYRARDMFKYLASPETYRYWKFRFQDASNPDTYIQIGYIMLGNATTMGYQFKHGWNVVHEFANMELESEYGAPFVAELYKRRRYRLEMRNLTSTEAAALLAIYISLLRNVYGLFLIPDAAVNDGYFGRFVNDLSFNVPYLYNAVLDFIEDSPGRTVGN